MKPGRKVHRTCDAARAEVLGHIARFDNTVRRYPTIGNLARPRSKPRWDWLN